VGNSNDRFNVNKVKCKGDIHEKGSDSNCSFAKASREAELMETELEDFRDKGK